MYQIIDPAHGPSAGARVKGPDNEAIPLCRHHHTEQHQIGWPAFESKYGYERAGMTLTKKQRAELFARFGGKCAYCGSVLPETGWHADHIAPIYRKTKMVKKDDDRWGSYKFVQTGECYNPENDRADNFMPSCRACNIDKSASDLENWRRSLERKVEVLRKNYSAFRHAERFGLVAQIGSKVVFHFETVMSSQALPDGGAPQAEKEK